MKTGLLVQDEKRQFDFHNSQSDPLEVKLTLCLIKHHVIVADATVVVKMIVVRTVQFVLRGNICDVRAEMVSDNLNLAS
jgi:hypothetical protein